MKDEGKTKEQLIAELAEARQQIAELEAAETERKRWALRLRESEEKYRNIVELAPDGIVTMDLRGVVTACNTAFLELTGYSEDEIVGRHFTKLPTLRARDLPKYISTFSSLLRGKPLKPLDFGWLDRSGRTRWGEAHLGTLKKAGKLAGVQLIARDITERKRAEEALRESERLLRRVIDATPAGIFIKDRTGNFILANDLHATIYGTTPEQLVGTNERDYSVYPTAVVEGFLEADREVIDSKQPKVIPEAFSPGPDGTARWFHTVKVPLTVGDNPDCVLGVGVDITERKQADQALQLSLEETPHSQRMLLALSQAAQAVQRAHTPDEVYHLR